LTSGIMRTGAAMTEPAELVRPPSKNSADGGEEDFAFLLSRTIEARENRPATTANRPQDDRSVDRKPLAEVDGREAARKEWGDLKEMEKGRSADEPVRGPEARKNGGLTRETSEEQVSRGTAEGRKFASPPYEERKRISSLSVRKEQDPFSARGKDTGRGGTKRLEKAEASVRAGSVDRNTEMLADAAAPNRIVFLSEEKTDMGNDKGYAAAGVRSSVDSRETAVKTASAATPDKGSAATAQALVNAALARHAGVSTKEGGAKEDGRKSAGSDAKERPDSPRVTVVDFRSRRSTQSSDNVRSLSADGKQDSKFGDKGTAARTDAQREPGTVVLELGRRPGDQAGRGEATAVRETFRDRFEKAVQGEIVKQTGIILRNEHSGEIRLVLKPDNLGSVRIRLSMDDNRIVGRILVENNSVRELFEQNMDSLTRALADQGYETGQFSVAVGGEGDGRRDGREGALPAARLARRMEENIPLLEEQEFEETLVNLVV